ncbi:MAG TPA: glycosyltransferase [Polyangia bacterium]|nr:glycosyltransferase [Polyangia bacterium]
MSTRRILYMQPSELFGGAERQIATVLPELQRQGAEVTALVGPGRTIVEWLQNAGVSDVVHSSTFPRDDSDVHGFEVLAYPGEFLAKAHAAEREVEALIEDRKIEVVLAGMAFSWLSATPAARRKGVPVIWRAGGMELSALQRTVLPLWARRNPPDALIGNGDAVRDLFSPLIPAPAYVVRNGVDTHLFRPGAAKGTMRPAGVGPVIGFAGRLAPQKRPQDFLAMAARIAARHSEVQFLIAGDGSRRPAYEKLAAKLGISARVHFLGQVEDMRAFYASCDLLVLPSRSEGSPNVVLEAMAMKLAVVASDTPATREVVTHLRDGILFPVGDVDKLTDAVDLSVSLPELRTMLAARALRKVRGPLSAGVSAATLSDVFESVLQGSGRREVAIPAVAAAAAVAAIG